MSVMGDDAPIGTQTPEVGHVGRQVSHLADLVGRGVAHEQSGGDARHGTIVSANYSLGGETVLVVHPDSRGGEVPGNTVLFGRPARWALEHLDAVDYALSEATSVEQTARRRLSAEQARTIPDTGSIAPGRRDVRVVRLWHTRDNTDRGFFSVRPGGDEHQDRRSCLLWAAARSRRQA